MYPLDITPRNGNVKVMRRQGRVILEKRVKQGLYKSMIGFSPEIIIILTGGIVGESKKDGALIYRFTKTNEGDAYGALWGESRILAAVELSKYFSNAKVLVTSIAKQQELGVMRAIQKKIGRILINRNRIIFENTSMNTVTQIGEAMKIVRKKQLKRIVFVTNEYHVPRAQAIFNSFELLEPVDEKAKMILSLVKHSSAFVKFVAAEDILPYCDRKYIKIISDFKRTPAYKKRLQSEKKGILLLESGQYRMMRTLRSSKIERLVD